MTLAERGGDGARWSLVGILIVIGVGWGSTQSLAKIAVSTGHAPMGLVFWQLAIGAVLLTALTLARGRPPVWGASQLRVYVLVALLGTVLPNSASYAAVRELPAGLLAILLSLVPMFAFVVALGLALEPFRWKRLAGLALGLFGVALLVLPEASLPDRAQVAWIPLALVAPFFYAWEGNVLAKWGTAGLDAIQVLAGASIVGALIAAPVALAAGAWIDPRPPWGAAEAALAASATIHAAVYAGYVWLIGRAGAVFAVQVSYVVTAAGVGWAMLLLGERYSGWIWLALIAVLAGLAMVQPRPPRPSTG